MYSLHFMKEKTVVQRRFLYSSHTHPSDDDALSTDRVQAQLSVLGRQ